MRMISLTVSKAVLPATPPRPPPPMPAATRPYKDQFEQFWRLYPAQVGNEASTYCAFVRAVKESNGDPDTIVTGAYLYANWCKKNLPRPDQRRFITHPENWLAKNGWTDKGRQLDGPINDPNRPVARTKSAATANNNIVVARTEWFCDYSTGKTHNCGHQGSAP